MLVLGRKQGESVLIDGGIRVTILRTNGRITRIGIEAPPEISIRRSELDACDDHVSQNIGVVESSVLDSVCQDTDIGASI